MYKLNMIVNILYLVKMFLKAISSNKGHLIIACIINYLQISTSNSKSNQNFLPLKQ